MPNNPIMRWHACAVKVGLGCLWVSGLALLLGLTCPPPPTNNVPYGVNSTYGSSPAPVVHDRAVEAGFKWYRITFLWDQIEPNAPVNGLHTYVWGSVADDIADAKSKGFAIIGDLLRTPSWAWDQPRAGCLPEEAGKEVFRPPTTAHAADFATFARTAAVLYYSDVAAWELWGEPNICGSWSGTADQYQERILTVGFDAIKGIGLSPLPLVVAPGLYNSAALDDYITVPFAPGFGHRALTRPIDRHSIHTYEGVSPSKDDLRAADGYFRCTQDFSFCTGDFWLTEFGFADAGSCSSSCPGCGFCPTEDPGQAATDIFDFCVFSIQVPFCTKAIYWNIANDYPCCKRWLVEGDGSISIPAGGKPPKFNTIKDYILSHPAMR